MRLRAQRGYTVVEVLVAITLIIVGTLSTVQVANAVHRASVGNEEKTVAANLAREGIEIVRNARDSNWQASSFAIHSQEQTGLAAAKNPWDCIGLAATDVTNKQPITCAARLSAGTYSYVPHFGTDNEAPYFSRYTGNGGITSAADYAAHPEYEICPTTPGGIYVSATANCQARPYYRRIVVERSGKTGAVDGACDSEPAGTSQHSLKVTSYVAWLQDNGKFHEEVKIEEYLTNWRRCTDVTATPPPVAATPNPTPNLPFSRMFHQVPYHDHFYTTNPAEYTAGQANGRDIFPGGSGAELYPFQKVEGFLAVSAAARPGAQPLYRGWKAAGFDDHFYTMSLTEFNTMKANGYLDEGIAGYLMPYTGTQPNYNNSCPAGTKPLYRIYHSGSNDHFYTTDINEVTALKDLTPGIPNDTNNNYTTREGVTGCIFNSATS